METILSSYIFSYFSLGFCIFSRETGGLNRIIDRGSRAINFILSAMVFNVVPTILEVWGWIFNWLLSYLTFMMPLDFVPWMLLFNFSDTYIIPYFGVFLGISYYTIILASSFFFLKQFYRFNMFPSRYLWYQVFCHTNLEQLLHGLLRYRLLHISFLHYQWHRYHFPI